MFGIVREKNALGYNDVFVYGTKSHYYDMEKTEYTSYPKPPHREDSEFNVPLLHLSDVSHINENTDAIVLERRRRLDKASTNFVHRYVVIINDKVYEYQLSEAVIGFEKDGTMMATEHHFIGMSNGVQYILRRGHCDMEDAFERDEDFDMLYNERNWYEFNLLSEKGRLRNKNSGMPLLYKQRLIISANA